jgi:hypothetical protein
MLGSTPRSSRTSRRHSARRSPYRTHAPPFRRRSIRRSRLDRGHRKECRSRSCRIRRCTYPKRWCPCKPDPRRRTCATSGRPPWKLERSSRRRCKHCRRSKLRRAHRNRFPNHWRRSCRCPPSSRRPDCLRRGCRCRPAESRCCCCTRGSRAASKLHKPRASSFAWHSTPFEDGAGTVLATREPTADVDGRRSNLSSNNFAMARATSRCSPHASRKGRTSSAMSIAPERRSPSANRIDNCSASAHGNESAHPRR